MRKKHRRNVYTVLLMAVLLLSVLVGCGGNRGQNTAGNTTGMDAPTISDTGSDETTPPEDSSYEVNDYSST